MKQSREPQAGDGPVNNTPEYEYVSVTSCGGASGQIASITLPGNSQVFFEYDKNGNLIRQTDPMGRETEYEYDAMGNQVKLITEQGRQQTFTYDKLGNMISRTDFGGRITRYAYDYRGLMTRTWIHLGETGDGETGDSHGKY